MPAASRAPELHRRSTDRPLSSGHRRVEGCLGAALNGATRLGERCAEDRLRRGALMPCCTRESARTSVVAFLLLLIGTPLRAQDLEPRAYTASPIGLHFLV